MECMEQIKGHQQQEDEILDDVEGEDLVQLEEEVEADNAGLNLSWILPVTLFAVIAVVLILMILGVFGFLSQAEYGGP